MVSAGDPLEERNRELIWHETTEAIRATQGVTSVFRLYNSEIPVRGREVLLSAFDAKALDENGRLPALGIEPSALHVVPLACSGSSVLYGLIPSSSSFFSLARSATRFLCRVSNCVFSRLKFADFGP